MVMRSSYAIFLPPSILLLLLLLHLTQRPNHSLWPISHPFTPKVHIEKALVVITRSLEISQWMEEVDPSWTKFTYLVTEDTLQNHSNITLSVPVNKGNEAMRYLSFIIDHYDNLPDIIAFRHGHKESWNQRADAPAEVNNLNLTAVRQRGYQNFRCTLFDGRLNHECPALGEDIPEDYWESVEPELATTFTDIWDAWFGGARPEYLMTACCAQFVVTRESVMSRSKEKYIEYRQWLIDTELEDYFSGRVLERTWHIIFGKPPVWCEREEDCDCQIYTGPLGCDQGSGSS